MRCNGMKEAVAIRYEKYMYTETRILACQSISRKSWKDSKVERSKMEEEFSSSLRDGRPLSSLIPLTRSWKAYKYEALMDIKNIVIWIFFIFFIFIFK